MKSPARLLSVLLLTVGCASAQQFWQPEVRRAEAVGTPVPSPTPARKEPPTAPAVPFENPPWMQRVTPSAAPSPAAAQTPYRPTGAAPVTVPTPTRPAPPVTAQTPYRPQGRIEVAPTPASSPEPGGSIRLSPTQQGDQEKAALERANSIYARKMYDLAIPEYEMFLISRGTGEGRDMAMFRLAECHRNLGNADAARAGYEKLVMEYKDGEFAGAGAYRLGEILFAKKLYDAALSQFQTATANAKGDEIRLSAQYYSARCLDNLKRPAEAAKAYRDIADLEKNNPYREYAMLALADISAKGGSKEDAFALYKSLSDSASKPAMQAEAAVKAAALAVELNKKDEAAKLFEKAGKLSPDGEWKAIATIGSLRLNFEAGDYAKVAAVNTASLKDLPGDSLPEALLLIANAQRQLGNHKQAQEAYDRLMREFPNSAPAQNARFHRLVSLYALNDKNLIKEIDDFLLVTSNPRERSQASLLKAEALFKTKNYAEAAKIYQSIPAADLPENLKAEAAYKLGWCMAATGDQESAIKIFSAFIDKNPDSKNVPAAIAQRGLSRQNSKDYKGAIEDFDLVISKYPDSAERELALQQKALILGQNQDYPGMSAAFNQLLKDYPKTQAAGQANFWIGWAAFESKDYPASIENLHKARESDPGQYGERATLRIILAYYYQEDRANLVREIAGMKSGSVPAEIILWLGMKSFDEGDYASTEKYLSPLTEKGSTIAPTPDVWINLAQARIRQGKFKEAQPAAAKYLETARDPASRSRGLLATAELQAGLKNYDDAIKLAEEALLLQPEGRRNAEARMIYADIQTARGEHDQAARAYMTISVLYDDPAITPLALQRAAEAYRKANNTLEADKALMELKQRYPSFQTTKVSKITTP